MELQDEWLKACTPAHFARTASQGIWIPYPHLLLLNTYLCHLIARRIRRLIVEMPPQHGKSELISRYFSSWALGSNPDASVILSGYNAEFAEEWGGKSRDLLEQWGKSLFGVSVSQKSNASKRWKIDGREGGMYAVGIGGPITGASLRRGDHRRPHQELRRVAIGLDQTAT